MKEEMKPCEIVVATSHKIACPDCVETTTGIGEERAPGWYCGILSEERPDDSLVGNERCTVANRATCMVAR